MVIESHPRLEDGSPFPTLFWLTCPVLSKRVSSLESTGWMRSTNETLAERGPLHRRLEQAISSYRLARDRLETIDDRGSVPGGGPDRIKCAHAHTAHDLATGANPIGALVLSAGGWPDCREPCFRVQP